jgi:flagellar motor switch protein FliN/FliY
MKTFLDCWISAAKTHFAKALAGDPQLIELDPDAVGSPGPAYVAEISGDLAGRFMVMPDEAILRAPILGDGIDQAAAWLELLREVAEGAARELMEACGQNCRIAAFQRTHHVEAASHAFQLTASGGSGIIWVCDVLRSAQKASQEIDEDHPAQLNPGVELLLDVELEATLRFGCREMPLGEILELGPGDVIELDRHVDDFVDLVVGDKIVARGEVVLVNGNFGLRVSEVATPRKRLESIRCLF